MPAHTFYLEAPDRSQDLLNIKWTLLSEGYSIGSIWHDGGASPSSLKNHWNAKSAEQMRTCDSLVVVCAKGDAPGPELGMIAGVALANGMQVIWIGPPIGALNTFKGVWQFKTVEDWLNQVPKRETVRSASVIERIAA